MFAFLYSFFQIYVHTYAYTQLYRLTPLAWTQLLTFSVFASFSEKNSLFFLNLSVGNIGRSNFSQHFSWLQFPLIKKLHFVYWYWLALCAKFTVSKDEKLYSSRFSFKSIKCNFSMILSHVILWKYLDAIMYGI